MGRIAKLTSLPPIPPNEAKPSPLPTCDNTDFRVVLSPEGTSSPILLSGTQTRVLKITPNEEDRPKGKIDRDSSDTAAITSVDISGSILDVTYHKGLTQTRELKITPNEEDRPEDKIGHDFSDTTVDISGLILDLSHKGPTQTRDLKITPNEEDRPEDLVMTPLT